MYCPPNILAVLPSPLSFESHSPQGWGRYSRGLLQAAVLPFTQPSASRFHPHLGDLGEALGVPPGVGSTHPSPGTHLHSQSSQGWEEPLGDPVLGPEAATPRLWDPKDMAARQADHREGSG